MGGRGVGVGVDGRHGARKTRWDPPSRSGAVAAAGSLVATTSRVTAIDLGLFFLPGRVETEALRNEFGEQADFGKLSGNPLEADEENGKERGVWDAYPSDTKAGHD
mmetsp:Transcript_29117/g.61488  ORF Transcript_29117/g.61488 Transcript_29117/m.61488 type:complete len:106 (-) Transcript_29117:60-377(-)